MSSSSESSPEPTDELVSALIPPGYIRSGENVILEEKPNFLAYITIGLVVWLGIGLLIWLTASAFFARVYDGWIGIIILFFIFPLPPLLKLYAARRRWSFAWYALTDERIISGGTGASLWSTSITDYVIRVPPGLQISGMSVYRIRQVTVSQNFLGRHFNFGNVVFIAEPSSFVWIGISNPVMIRKILEEKVVNIYEAEYVNRSVKEVFTGEVAKSYAEIHADEARKIASSISSPTEDASIPKSEHNLIGKSTLNECPSCGYLNTDPSAKFCARCGHQLR